VEAETRFQKAREHTEGGPAANPHKEKKGITDSGEKALKCRKNGEAISAMKSPTGDEQKRNSFKVGGKSETNQKKWKGGSGKEERAEKRGEKISKINERGNWGGRPENGKRVGCGERKPVKKKPKDLPREVQGT